MRRGWSLFVGVTFLGLLGLAVWFAVDRVGGWFDGLSKEQAVAVAGLSGVVLAPIVSYLTTRSLERRRQVREATLARRVELYEEFVTFFMRVMAGEDVPENETIAFFRSITPRLVAYSSNDVLRRWGHLRLRLASGVDSSAALFEAEDFFKAIRKDLGFGATSLRKGDVLRLTVNDIDDHL